MDKELEKLADQYEGNLLNYFCGMTPKQSKKFNKMLKDAKKNRRLKWKTLTKTKLNLTHLNLKD